MKLRHLIPFLIFAPVGALACNAPGQTDFNAPPSSSAPRATATVGEETVALAPYATGLKATIYHAWAMDKDCKVKPLLIEAFRDGTADDHVECASVSVEDVTFACTDTDGSGRTYTYDPTTATLRIAGETDIPDPAALHLGKNGKPNGKEKLVPYSKKRH